VWDLRLNHIHSRISTSRSLIGRRFVRQISRCQALHSWERLLWDAGQGRVRSAPQLPVQADSWTKPNGSAGDAHARRHPSIIRPNAHAYCGRVIGNPCPSIHEREGH
jgi:hypothetical protein